MLSKKKIKEFFDVDDFPGEVDDIHWKAQDSTSSSILFYKITENNNSEADFYKRIQNAQYSLLVVSRKVNNPPANSVIISDELWPSLQKKCLDILYPMPKLKMIGITGTNGKTTTADIVLQLGEMLGKSGFSIGTLGVREKNRTILDFGQTSPSYIDLRKFLSKYGSGKDFCVMEASSHALIQDRLYQIEFDGVGWTSFSQDHLDYHQTMEAYFDAKARIVEHLKEYAFVFVPAEQNELYQRICNKTDRAKKSESIESALPLFFKTQFNKNNLEVAVSLVQEVLGLKIKDEWFKIIPPDGRFYIRSYKSSYIVVDFAHTPDALKNICVGIKKAFPDYKLKVLFGCGGDRDRSKRPQMGNVAELFADIIYLTSDNPRTEDPNVIIQDILKGIKQKKVIEIIDRPNAVSRAFSEIGEKEVLLLAGKGHEDYILINGIKYHYSDIEEVDKFLNKEKL